MDGIGGYFRLGGLSFVDLYIVEVGHIGGV
jgi:hypothetical protein